MIKKVVKSCILFFCNEFELQPCEVVQSFIVALCSVTAIAFSIKPFFGLVVTIGKVFNIM